MENALKKTDNRSGFQRYKAVKERAVFLKFVGLIV